MNFGTWGMSDFLGCQSLEDLLTSDAKYHLLILSRPAWCVTLNLLQSEREDIDSAQRVKDHTQTLTTVSYSITSEDSLDGLGALPSAAQAQHRQHTAQTGASVDRSVKSREG